MKYAAFHESERGFKTQRRARQWIKDHAEMNNDARLAKKWRVVGVVEIKRRKGRAK